MANGRGIMYYWPVIFLAVTTLVSGGGLLTQVNALADDVEKMEAKEADLENKVTTLATKQDAIKEDIDEIKEEQKEQSRKLDRILEKLN